MRTVFGMLATFIACAYFSAASAADFPAKPVRLILGTGTGTIDIVARLFATKLGDRLGQRVVVENRPGSSEMIGLKAVRQAEPDGYTLGWTSSGYPALPVLTKGVDFDILKDFAPISLVAQGRMVVMGSLKAPFKTADQLVAYMKANSGKVNLATGSAGAAVLQAQWFMFGSGAKLELIRYAGGVQAAQAVMSGEADIMIQVVGPAKAAAEAGKVRILGFTGTQRVDALPNVPAFSESSVSELRELANAGFGIFWFGLLAPVGMPRQAQGVIVEQTLEVARDPDFARRLRNLDMSPVGSRPEAFAQQIAKEAETWRSIGSAAGITPQ